jgi:hypothetical protein
MKMKLIFIIATLLITLNAHSDVVTESWLRQAGISCGGGLSFELQGEIDTAVIKKFKLASIQGEGSLQISEAEALLKQFQKEEKRQTYVDYVNCLITLMNMASNTSQLPPREVILESSVAVAPLETIKRGQRFVLNTGDTIAINSHALIFTLDSISRTKSPIKIEYTWSNSESGEGKTRWAKQSQLIQFSQDCSIVPYMIDIENKQVSFISNC